MPRETLNEYVRNQFPALKNEVDGKPAAYLDGPAGYQVPRRVIRAVEDYFVNMNANTEGAFVTSKKNDEMINSARHIFADFFNCSWDEVVFGANMTTMNFALSLALMREMQAGDRVIITELDHEGNRGPWQQLRERGIIIDEVAVDIDTCTLDMNDFSKKLNPNTKVVAVTHASNCVGTITDVKKIVALAKDAGAYAVIDAVHYAAHGPIDVKEMGADFLLCSAYKFFGPHIGAMYAKRDVLSKLTPLKVNEQFNYPPYMMETGTLHHEGIAGAAEAVEFVADVGEKFGGKFKSKTANEETTRRKRIVEGLLVFESYEEELTKYLIDELSHIKEVTIYGPPEGYPRTSTVSITHNDYTPRQIAEYLGDRGIFVWDGDFYAVKLVERLGLGDKGGVIRIGIAPYNTKEELSRLITALNDKEALENFIKRSE